MNLKYPCLVLDHDDTVVQSEATVNYPYFCQVLQAFRPGQTMTLQEYLQGCSQDGFPQMCRRRFGFTAEELEAEHRGWKAYIRTHAPVLFPGVSRIIRRQKEEGGLVCVVSHSCSDMIRRDYHSLLNLTPDAIYGWDLPEHQRKPGTFPLTDLMQRFSLSPAQMLVVDDMRSGWEMASRIGAPTAFAAWGRQAFPELCTEMETRCDFTFYTTKELENFLFE